ncbi:RraA family protein [Mucilaginibacter auburnensis]|uniref:Regulator of RNase E activity RraA n=1 Tax=Mucilaginibacter auburnensis TaxID=1457233 RepID=A0A2H9VTZ7_9SPHI|nr:dimethylmenaquinone methyltransferase [Mucilaginibacter auburnensis]PJJ84300.1 regulator of RNase E activity RraA [Mucilaginibacter auburnensis]
MKKTNLTIVALALLLSASVKVSAQTAAQAPAQPQVNQADRDELIFLTPEWKGERFPDGRPKVPEDIIQRMKSVSIEEAWATMGGSRFNYQLAEDWNIKINPDSVLCGRALTVTFMPYRPDMWKAIDERGKKEGRRAQNVWGVEQLQKGDVYVADQFGLHKNGPTIGDRVAADIYKRTGTGIVYNGAIRDLEGLKELGGFTSYVDSYSPSYHNPGSDQNTMIMGVNKPTRIRQVTVMPGDVVLGKQGVVIFIPPHLAEKVVKASERTRLEDMFAHIRTAEGKYTAGQMDANWPAPIREDYLAWLKAAVKDKKIKLPVAKAQVEEIIAAADVANVH